MEEEITKVVKKQKELGFHIITDGEFRRSFWHLDFMWGLEGVAHENTGSGVKFDAELALLDDTYLVGKIKAKAHPFVEYYKFLKQFYDAGCRNLQLDDCTWGAIVGDAAKHRYKSLGIDLEEVKKQLLAVNNLALENKPEDMVITSHICRGNYHSTFFSSGAYDSVADYVFANENVNALFLEYDDERSGGFASCEIGNKLTEEEQWAKLKLVKEIAEEVF